MLAEDTFDEPSAAHDWRGGGSVGRYFEHTGLSDDAAAVVVVGERDFLKFLTGFKWQAVMVSEALIHDGEVGVDHMSYTQIVLNHQT